MSKRRRWAKCDECGGEVWFDAWVDLNGELAGGPYQNTHCETCEGETSYTEVDGDPPDLDVDDDEDTEADIEDQLWEIDNEEDDDDEQEACDD